MKLLLTGATGFLGYRTLERLAELPWVDGIRATGRILKPTHEVRHPKVTYQLGDLADAGFVRKMTEGVEGIVHAAALSSPWGPSGAFRQANLVPQQHLLEAARQHGIRRFVYISTPSIYFTARDRWNVQESDPLPARLVNDYARTKYAAEHLLVASGIPYIILRPRAIIGRGDTVIMPRLIRAAREGKLKVIGSGRNQVDLTSAANATQAIERALVAGNEALNEDYNITNGEPVALWDCIREVLHHLGHTLPPGRVPVALAQTAATVMEWKARWTGSGEPALTRYGVGTLARSFTMDISKARDRLGYRPEMSTSEALHEFVHWYLQQAHA